MTLPSSNNTTAIVIPARYGSTRLPGKPLIKIAGKTLLQRVCEVASLAAEQLPGVFVLVATDDQRIMDHAKTLNVESILTTTDCATGTDRIYAAIQQLENKPQYIINLQGDAPLTPVAVIIDLINKLKQHPIVTPAMQLPWSELDTLRLAKQTNPFSGTSVIINTNNEAVWFSKQILPAIRSEAELRAKNSLSPVYQHLGIYGYSLAMLETFTHLEPSYYEQLEGLEQLRLLENGYKINMVPVQLDNLLAWRGVDTISDAEYVAKLIIDEAI